MHFLTLIPFLALLTLAAPIEKRAPSVSCGGRSFTSSQVNKAVQNSNSDAAPSSSYPHQYNNYEGFDFSDYCSDSRYEEFPLTSGGVSTGWTVNEFYSPLTRPRLPSASLPSPRLTVHWVSFLRCP